MTEQDRRWKPDCQCNIVSVKNGHAVDGEEGCFEMQGFDAGFRDLPDYIEKITREIWEERGIGQSLDKYYAPDIIVRAPPGVTTSNAGVTAATLGTLHEFPDRRLVYEDVIWSGNEVDGFLSSRNENAGTEVASLASSLRA